MDGLSDETSQKAFELSAQCFEAKASGDKEKAAELNKQAMDAHLDALREGGMGGFADMMMSMMTSLTKTPK